MSEREEIAPNGGKRDMRPDETGQTKAKLDEIASLSAGIRYSSVYDVEPGEGDGGDYHKH